LVLLVRKETPVLLAQTLQSLDRKEKSVLKAIQAKLAPMA
jgi:hypothetical protein